MTRGLACGVVTGPRVRRTRRAAATACTARRQAAAQDARSSGAYALSHRCDGISALLQFLKCVSERKRALPPRSRRVIAPMRRQAAVADRLGTWYDRGPSGDAAAVPPALVRTTRRSRTATRSSHHCQGLLGLPAIWTPHWRRCWRHSPGLTPRRVLCASLRACRMHASRHAARGRMCRHPGVAAIPCRRASYSRTPGVLQYYAERAAGMDARAMRRSRRLAASTRRARHLHGIAGGPAARAGGGPRVALCFGTPAVCTPDAQSDRSSQRCTRGRRGT